VTSQPSRLRAAPFSDAFARLIPKSAAKESPFFIRSRKYERLSKIGKSPILGEKQTNRLPMVFSVCNLSRLLIFWSKSAIMSESDGNTKELGISWYVYLSGCVLAVESHSGSSGKFYQSNDLLFLQVRAQTKFSIHGP
jgi:hypothetical protein